jgi:hypothetical protein
MIRFSNLLENHRAFSLFWKTTLERLSVSEAPFFSRIDTNTLMIGDQTCSLREEPAYVVDFCRQQWEIPKPIASWKNIKKECVKIFLLQDYLARQNLSTRDILRLQQWLGDKTLSADDIVLEQGKIVDIRGLTELVI